MIKIDYSRERAATLSVNSLTTVEVGHQAEKAPLRIRDEVRSRAFAS